MESTRTRSCLWSVFSHIWTKHGDFESKRRFTEYAGRIRKNTNQKILWIRILLTQRMTLVQSSSPKICYREALSSYVISYRALAYNYVYYFWKKKSLSYAKKVFYQMISLNCSIDLHNSFNLSSVIVLRLTMQGNFLFLFIYFFLFLFIYSFILLYQKFENHRLFILSYSRRE